ncbi:MAG: helix-turn-helix domain-containing protein, partial [Acetivibrio ethanolgignens]
MDNFTEAEQKRLKLIQQIQEMYQAGISIREITRRFQINRQTTRKYLSGDPMILCRSNKRSNLDQHKDFIIKCLTEGKTQSETA